MRTRLEKNKNFFKVFKMSKDVSSSDSLNNRISMVSISDDDDKNPTFDNYTIRVQYFKNPSSISMDREPVEISNPLTEDGSWDYLSQYTFEFELSDKLTTQAITKVVYSSVPIYDFWEDSNRNKFFEVNGKMLTRSLEVSEGIKVKGENVQNFVSHILYDNPNGSNYNITLNKNASDYTKTDIIYKDDNNIYSCLSVFNDGWYTLLITQFDNNKIVFRGKNVQVSGNQIVNGNYGVLERVSSGINFYQNNNIYITKVIGYK